MNVMVESILLIQSIVMHRRVLFARAVWASEENTRSQVLISRRRSATKLDVLTRSPFSHTSSSLNYLSKSIFQTLLQAAVRFLFLPFLRCSRRHPLLFLVSPSVFLLLITLSGRHTSDRARLSLIHCHPIFFHDAYVAHSFFRCSWWESSQHTHTSILSFLCFIVN